MALLAFGRMVSLSCEAADLLAREGIDARVVDMRWVKPLDRQAIRRAAETQLVVTVEGGVVAGGAGEGVLAVLAEEGRSVPALNLGIEDRFIHQGKTSLLLGDLGLDGKGIAERVERKFLSL